MKLLLTTLLMMFLACSVQAKTFVVCVGVSDYPGTGNDLRVSANDAEVVHKIFQTNRHASSVCHTNAAASSRQLFAAMRSQFAQAGPDDVVMLYFSGHGVPGGLVCYDRIVRYQELIQAMAAHRARHKVVLVDACYSGKMRKGRKKDTTPSSSNVMFFLSSRSIERSMETPFKNSLFTIFLERGLRGGADTNKDRTITARELYNFVHPGVVQQSAAIRRPQHPVMWGKFSNEMPIIKW